MKQDKADKIIQKAERRAAKAAKQVEIAGRKAEQTKQKQAAKAEKKAAQAARRADLKAAKHTKKAEQATKKAQLAAQKAQEKKAKIAAKTAAKAVEGEEGGGDGKKKKKGKKKLLLILIPVLAVAIGAGVFFFLKGGEKEEEAPPEPIPIPLEYLLNEVPITALPVTGEEVLVYQEEVPPEPPAEPEEPEEAPKDGGEDAAEDGEASGGDSEDGGEAEAAPEPEAEEEPGFTRILYRYEGLKNPKSLVTAYAAVMSTEDAGFSLVDETLLRIDPPEEYGASGSLLLARNVPTAEDGSGGGVHSLLLSWEETSCSVLLDMPEGRVHDPKPETPPAAATRRGLSDLKAIHPSKLGLPGESMEAYELIPQEGSVRIAGTGSVAMRVNIYGEGNQFAGSYFLSNDGRLYKLDEAANAVVELEWE
ncbi:MAG: hypothetical protein HFF99_02585 [Oscillibacter sp.]|nr:hypothetical protein [uncultured Oscillibacter sp.]MCI8970330.1 hypothetical protein [Oscillibacter sp.]